MTCHTAVRKVFGDTGFIQRCTLRKRRNVRGKTIKRCVPPGCSTRNAASAGSRATGRCGRWSLRPPVTWML
jgi:hypothetical protein